MVDPKLIFSIRQELNNLPEDYVSDESIVQSILKAKAFIDGIVRSDASTYDIDQAVLRLATYYTYLNYLSLSNRAFGSIPEYSPEFGETLRRIALFFVRKISKYDIDDNFNILEPEKQPIGFGTVGAL